MRPQDRKAGPGTGHARPRLLLHSCCGPCTLVPYGIFADEGWDVTICYVNPNIQPPEEYEKRLNVLRLWAKLIEVPVIEGPCDRDAWEREVAPYGTNRVKRCEACYALRLREAGRIAAEGGFDAIATTLAISPYQLLDACNRQLVRVGREVGVEPLPRDFQRRYPESVTQSRELGMYRQNYCGCRFSAAEAAVGRAEAREQRRLAKEIDRAWSKSKA